jgi:hypothetical protein
VPATPAGGGLALRSDLEADLLSELALLMQLATQASCFNSCVELQLSVYAVLSCVLSGASSPYDAQVRALPSPSLFHEFVHWLC